MAQGQNAKKNGKKKFFKRWPIGWLGKGRDNKELKRQSNKIERRQATEDILNQRRQNENI